MESSTKLQLLRVQFDLLSLKESHPALYETITEAIKAERKYKTAYEILKEANEFYCHENNYSGGYYNTISNDAEDTAREARKKAEEILNGTST